MRSRPFIFRTSTPTDRLFKLFLMKVAPICLPSGSTMNGVEARPLSPRIGSSIFMTSAPSRANNWVAKGIACICSTARTRRPSSGFPNSVASGLATSPSSIRPLAGRLHPLIIR